MESKILQIIYPSRCPYCNVVISKEEEACDKCKKYFPDYGNITVVFEKGENMVLCVSPFSYRGVVNDAILRFKFKSCKSYGNQFAVSMAKEIEEYFNDIHFDFVTEVPMSFWQKTVRGYNQSNVLALALSKELNIPYKKLLKKIVKNKEQHKLLPNQRESNVLGVYSTKNNDIIKGKTILLCDDIITTGNTLKECAKMLFKAGALNIVCVTIAKA